MSDILKIYEAYHQVYAPQEVDEATAMAKRGHDETKLRKRPGGGEAADRATALENKPTYGDKNKQAQRSRYARTQRGDFRNTASSNPGLHGYGHQSNDPKVKAIQAARGAQRGALTPKERQQLNMGDETFDIFDIVLEYLCVEGFAETLEEAEWMMANELSAEEIDAIVEAQLKYGGDNSPFNSRQDFLDSLKAYDEKQKKKTPQQRKAEVDAYAKRQREDK
jgi:hypothetical protein